jgi:hypothetical protein
MNSKGQIVVVKLMFAILLLIATIFLVPVVQQTITGAGNTSANLNCSSSTNNNVTNATCIVMDMGFFYFISSCIAVGLAFLTGRKTITGVLAAIFTTIVVIVLITPLKSFIVLLRDSGHLNCSAANISVGAKMLCIFADLWLFYFVVAAIAAAITYITLKEFVPESP